MSNSTRRSPVNRPTSRSRPQQPVRRPPAPPVRRPAGEWLTALQRDPRWILLVLRGYLGFTFVYAGLSKVGGSFLDSSSPTGMHATLVAVRGQSPIGGLLGPVEHHSFAFGLLMAIAETAVGVGMLLGLFTRVAALGGVLISLSLFLTVSWNANPWYTGADIVYLFAFTPLLLGGAGPLALDGWLAAARARDDSPFAKEEDAKRRVVLGGIAGIGGLVAVGIASAFRSSSPSQNAPVAGGGNAGTTTPAQPTTSPAASKSASSSAAPAGQAIVAASAVPVGGAVQATDPKTGEPIFVLQLRPGSYSAVGRICPHQGCEVAFVSASQGFECPCHLSTFDPTGAVTQGPAATGLDKIKVAKSGSQIVRT